MSAMTCPAIEIERAFHDRQAAERKQAFRTGQAHLRFQDAEYLDHESWIRPAMAMMGDVNGQPVLDYGCGHGMAAAVLARAGAHVTAFDLSPGYVRETLDRAEANGVHIQAVPADAHTLPFADESFAAIWGNAVLHHLDLRQAAREIRRVLRPGGVAVFCEPWGGNRLLEFARKWLPYPGKARTPDEHPLTTGDVATLREVFPDLALHGQQLLAMAGRVAPRYLASSNLHRADAWLLRHFPQLQAYTRYMVLVFRKPCDTLRID